MRPRSLHKYLFTENNPINLKDHSGLFSGSFELSGTAAIGTGVDTGAGGVGVATASAAETGIFAAIPTVAETAAPVVSTATATSTAAVEATSVIGGIETLMETVIEIEIFVPPNINIDVDDDESDDIPVYLCFKFIFPHVAQNIEVAIGDGAPSVLTYMEDKTSQDDNRKMAYQDQGYPDLEGISWDEYPFASTYEGGMNASIAPCPPLENSLQGLDLANFYNRNHINDSDPFLVEVVP